jgi:hypothetical protein
MGAIPLSEEREELVDKETVLRFLLSVFCSFCAARQRSESCRIQFSGESAHHRPNSAQRRAAQQSLWPQSGVFAECSRGRITGAQDIRAVRKRLKTRSTQNVRGCPGW